MTNHLFPKNAEFWAEPGSKWVRETTSGSDPCSLCGAWVEMGPRSVSELIAPIFEREGMFI